MHSKFQFSYISIACSSRFSASLATETAQHERPKTSKPFIFNKTTIQSRSYLRGFSKPVRPKRHRSRPQIGKIPNEPIQRL
jgi:hypothetical protein